MKHIFSIICLLLAILWPVRLWAQNVPVSLTGNSIHGDASYYEFTSSQLIDFFSMMTMNEEKLDAKKNSWRTCNYELEAKGPFYITWVNGNVMDQRSHILGYYYHSPNTYDDIKYVDLSETHKWDYIDGLAKVQYQISSDKDINGYKFKANTWYDANFDMHDTYTNAHPNNPDREGDNAYNSQAVYDYHKDNITGLRSISFKIDLPEGTRIGFYLRSDEELYPDQWTLLKSKGFKPYVDNQDEFMGTNFSAEFLNIEGNGLGTHRSFIKDYDEVYWMGMEDLIEGGDHDCNDVIFGLVADLKIMMPDIVELSSVAPSQEESCATPTFTHEGNAITIGTVTEGARIYYTLDGTDPTTESTLYTGPITLTQNCTVKAIAVADGYMDSEVATYIVDWIGESEPEPYAVLSDDGKTVTFYYDDQKAARGGIDINDKTNYNGPPYATATTAVFDVSFANYLPTSTACWFMSCFSLETITGVENLKTDNVTNMGAMFFYCTGLKNLDVSGFKTDNVTDMTYMFGLCSSLSSLDVSGFKTDNVTSMFGMFHGCSGLKSLDVSGFNTSNVTTMQGMFRDCSGLTNLYVSHFDTQNVTSMGYMFYRCSGLSSLDLSSFNTSKIELYDGNNSYAIANMFFGCSNLTTIYVGDGWTTANLTESPGVFELCTRLVGGKGTKYDANHTDYTYAHIDGGTSNPGYFTDKNAPAVVTEAEPYAVLSDNNTVLTFYYDDLKEARGGMGVGPFNTYSFGIDSGWYDYRENITSVVFDASFANCTTITSTAYWFYTLTNLTSISGLQYLKTDNVTDMSCMFMSCLKLTSLDLSRFKTDKVTDMRGMFWTCRSLEHLDVSHFNTQNVTNMLYMFLGCSSLAAIQAGSAKIPKEQYAEIGNPNLLVYVNEAGLAPQGIQNVVINGVAREIILTDPVVSGVPENPEVSGNYNFFCPTPFTAQKISYSHTYNQQSGIDGQCRGWETIALPFTVQTITHRVKGTIAPFGAQGLQIPENGGGLQIPENAPRFWLCELGRTRFENATTIEANKPYIISMPQNPEYLPQYNLGQDVITFAATNVTVPATAPQSATAGQRTIYANFTAQPASERIYTMNVSAPYDGHAEGSVFVPGQRAVRPFEAYTTSANGTRYIELFDDEINSITDVEKGQRQIFNVQSSLFNVYDLGGSRIKDGTSLHKRLVIKNGKVRATW